MLTERLLASVGLTRDDLKQEAFLHPGKFSAINAIRRYGWSDRRNLKILTPLESVVLKCDSNESALIAAIDIEKLLSLPSPAQSDVVKLHHLEDMTFPEIAKVRGITRNAVSNRCGLGIKKMSEYVKTR